MEVGSLTSGAGMVSGILPLFTQADWFYRGLGAHCGREGRLACFACWNLPPIHIRYKRLHQGVEAVQGKTNLWRLVSRVYFFRTSPSGCHIIEARIRMSMCIARATSRLLVCNVEIVCNEIIQSVQTKFVEYRTLLAS